MKLGISVKIDVTKIDKARLFKGEKGTYLDLTTFINLGQQDQFGNNGFISQSVSQEERQQNVQTPILGNVKVFYSEQSNAPIPQQASQQPNAYAAAQQGGTAMNNGVPPVDDFDQDIPFAPYKPIC